MTASPEDAPQAAAVRPSPFQPPALVLEQVSRSYGNALALAPLTLQVQPGSLCLVTGANGSGKTTLLRLAAGLLTPTDGQRRVSGAACYLRAGDGARSPQRVSDAVGFAAGLGGGDAATALAAADLEGLDARRAEQLSAGQRARLTLAVAHACQPALACLDEPTAHLDADGVAAARGVLGRLTDAGAAVLVATPDAQSLRDVADVVLRLRDGHVEDAA